MLTTRNTEAVRSLSLSETRRSGGLFWEAGLTPSGPAGVPFPPDRLLGPALATFPNYGLWPNEAGTV